MLYTNNKFKVFSMLLTDSKNFQDFKFMSFLFISICFFYLIDAIFIGMVTKLYLNNLIIFYIYSVLLFIPISHATEEQKKTLLLLFFIYHIARFSFNINEKLEDIDIMENSIETIFIILAAKCGWVFFILSILNHNMKQYLCNSLIFMLVSAVVYNFALYSFLMFLMLFIIIKLINIFIKFNKYVESFANSIFYFASSYFILEIITNINLIFISSNLLNLIGFFYNAEVIKSLTNDNMSFKFFNYFFTENLVGFNEKLYIEDGYLNLIKNDILHALNKIRDKLSYLFLLIICFYKHRSGYISHIVKLFIIFSMCLFILNFFYFLDIKIKNEDVFIKIIYSIVFYYIVYLSIEFNIMNKQFLKSNFIYFILILTLYIINDTLYNAYKINFLNYIIFFILFKIKDNINVNENNKLFTINILFSFLMLGLTFNLINSDADYYSKIYNITIVSLLSIKILYFTKSLKNIFISCRNYIYALCVYIFYKYAKYLYIKKQQK